MSPLTDDLRQLNKILQDIIQNGFRVFYGFSDKYPQGCYMIALDIILSAEEETKVRKVVTKYFEGRNDNYEIERAPF